ncbi:MAG: hypothetical protein HKN33_18030 [Pyrinomonadaceae bacterium]|nr:hypothetical protein [Pyrinomonadaceae bacterium]
MKFVLIIAIAILSISCTESVVTKAQSEYAGQERREIKSLSADDIKQLENGQGWGLAKAAELNGLPGPVHLIEMKDKIGLEGTKLKKIEKLYNEMKKNAVPLGKRLIELEKELDRGFSKKTIDSESLKTQLSEIAKVRADLRFVHLSTHLKTPEILTKEQISKYNELRGYGKGDPCKNVPEGHDPAMWKKHNNCG